MIETLRQRTSTEDLTLGLDMDENRAFGNSDLDYMELCECLFEGSHDAAFLVRDGRVIAANSRALQLTGYEQHQLLNSSVDEILMASDGLQDEHAAVSLQLHESSAGDCVVRTSTGDRVPVRVQISQVNGPPRPVSLVFVRDVSSERQVDVLQAVLDNAADGIVVLDRAGEFLHFNPAAERILGRGPSDVPIGERAEYYGAFHSDGTTRLALQDLPLRRAIHGEDVSECEILIRNSTHTEGVWCSINASPLRGEDGTTHGAVGAFRDVSARKKADEELREHEQFLDLILNSLSAHIAILNASGEITAVNSAWQKFADANELAMSGGAVGSNYLEFCDNACGQDAEEARGAAQGIRDVIERRRTSFYVEYPCHGPGVQRWFALRVTPLEVSHRGHVIVAHEDITERKRTEEKLRLSQLELQQSNERLALAISGTTDGIWDWDISADTVWMSPRGMELIGREPIEWTARPADWSRLIHPDDRGGIAKAVEEHLHEGGGFEAEFRMALPDGTYRWFNSRGSAKVDQSGRPVRMSGALRDISESRATAQRSEEIQEEAIRAHNQLVEAIESLTEGFALYDSDDRLVICNSKYKDIYEISRDLLVPGAKFEDHIRESAYRGQIASAVGREEEWVRERLQQHQQPEGPYIQKLGNGRWLQVSERKTREGGIVGVRTDITDRVVAEESLRTSEAMFRGLTESSPALVAIVQGMKHAYVNPVFTAFLGYSQRELLEMSFLDYVHPDDRELVRQRSLDRQEGKDVESRYEIRLVTKDGEERRTDFGATRVTFNGAPAVLGVALDITKQRQAEDRLRESEERYRTVLENHADGVMVVVNGRMQYVNAPMCDMCGRSRAELVGSLASDVLSTACSECFQGLSRGDGRDSSPIECEVLHQSGHSVAVEVVSRAIRLRDDEAALLVVRDVSWRKEMEEQARQHRKLLARANRVSMLGEMATGLAHELNQPLAAIAMLADASQAKLASGIRDEQQLKPILNTLSMQSRRAGEIVDRIRQFIGKEDFVRTPYPVAELVRGVLAFLGPDLREHECVVDAPELDGLPDVEVDRVQIEQVLVNLIHNSIDAYVESGVADRRLVIHAERTGPEVVTMSLTDFGPGMSKEAAGKVFNAFYSTKDKGMGMGLAICRSIVEAHQGRIAVETEPGAGVTFQFTLPVARRESDGKRN